MSMKDGFSIEQFRDAFEVTTKVKNKLQPFIAKYKEQNMSWIIKSLEEIHRLFFDKNVDLHLKFNSIFGIKFIFDIGDQVLVNFIEIYFLPKILEIASYEINAPDQKRGTNYFIKEGYPKTHEDIAKFGYNFVRMASEFIPAAAQVKPRRIFEGEQLHQKSQFAQALITLEKSGWKPYPSPVYYKEGAAMSIRSAFELSIEQQAVDRYVDFYTKIFKQYIVEEKMPNMRMNPFKIIESCDSYITAALIQMCEDEFQNPSLKARKKVLQLLNQMIMWGDIEAAHLVNCTPLLDETMNEVADPINPSQLLSRGRGIFQKNSSSEEIKQQFYLEFLKCIQFWALCYPKGIKIKNRESKVKFWHNELRNKLQIEFPDDKDLKKNKAIFDKASEINKERNNILIAQLKELDSELQPLKTLNSINSGLIEKEQVSSSKAIPPTIKQTPTPQDHPIPGSQSSDYNRINREINEVNISIDTLCDSQSKLDSKIQKIKLFMKIYEKEMQNVGSLSDVQFDDILNKADLLIERIQKINPTLDKYEAKKITFDEFVGLIQGKRPSSPQKKSEVKIQSKNEIKDFQNESLNSSSGNLPQYEHKSLKSAVISPRKGQQSSTLKNQAKSKSPSLKKIDDVTPIKKIKEDFEDHQKFSESNNLSSLPEISRKSVDLKNENVKNFSKPDLKKNEDPEQGVNIQPASHTILGNSRPSIKNIEPEKKRENVPTSFQRFQDSYEPEKKKLEKVQQPSSSNRFLDNSENELKKKSDLAQHVQNKFIESEKEVKKKVEPIQQSFKNFLEKDEKEHEEKMKTTEIQQSFKKFLESDSPIKGETISKKVIQDIPVNIEELHEQIEQNIAANVPKSLKNITGSNRQSPSQNIFKGEDSRKSSKIKFEESKIEKNNDDEDDNDLIILPDSNPLDESYHEIKFSDSFSLKNPKELSFKKCFEGDKYLFGQDRLSKKYKLANDTFNLIKRSDSSRKASKNKESKISIPSLLEERSKKFEEEIKYVEEKKNRKISELETKIKLLQSTGEVMKDKIMQQEREIKTIKAFSEADNSRVKRNSLLQDQDAIFKAKLATVQNKSVKNDTFYQSRKDPRYLDPTGTLINNRKYKDYFQQFGTQKQKKNLLKNKELLLKNEQIEFGCMTKRERETLVVIFYITPSSDLDGLVSRIVSNDSNLEIELQPKNIPSIRKGKQEKITAHINVINIPYHLPEIQFTYNLEHKLDTQKFVIPCAFHKFVHLAPTDEKEVSRQFQRRDKILRGEEVPYSKKLLKNIGNLSDYFSGGVLMRNGEPNPNGELEFGGKVIWKHEEFWIRLMVRPNQFLYVQAIPDSNRQTTEYYVSIITNLLMKNIDLKEM